MENGAETCFPVACISASFTYHERMVIIMRVGADACSGLWSELIRFAIAVWRSKYLVYEFGTGVVICRRQPIEGGNAHARRDTKVHLSGWHSSVINVEAV